MNMAKLQNEIHKNAVEHGWWDEPRTFGDVIALCHSELSEALEAYLNGETMVWKGEAGKPEGVAVELADCIIRILDWAGHEDVDMIGIANQERNFLYLIRKTMSDEWWNKPVNFIEVVIFCHTCLSHSLESYRAGEPMCFVDDENDALQGVAIGMAHCIIRIQNWAKHNDVDIWKIVRLKHEYNKSRPYRHGGKAL